MVLAGVCLTRRQLIVKDPEGEQRLCYRQSPALKIRSAPMIPCGGAAWTLIIPPTIKQRKKDYDSQCPQSQGPKTFVSDVNLYSKQILNRKRWNGWSSFINFSLLLWITDYLSCYPIWCKDTRYRRKKIITLNLYCFLTRTYLCNTFCLLRGDIKLSKPDLFHNWNVQLQCRHLATNWNTDLSRIAARRTII